ncbi:uncharacterized protein EI90DRAFT_2934880 [Cantharellus anzutake]|uniref:uncharacterized protein n=1 Tax=Cantharellus anzutake TaxID=1750568 RepID=UPI00190880D8|nr:uncharacterized protein EI90DRAFT_2934880 [Cantharellus anzutake]KAF8324311.1 hypothetical protein EI90DRAFT_2934880 [Cantharellus anzutake]
MAVAEAATTNSNTKFPHTRALLSALAREYGTAVRAPVRPASENSDSEADSGGEVDVFNSDHLVAQVIQLLDQDEEEKVEDLLKESFRISDETVLEQNVLELMHKRRDDLANVPFLFLTPIKRPSRPTSRASVHSTRSSRPGTPSQSPLAMSFRRPSTPLASHTTLSGSPSSSPTPAPSLPTPTSSPLASPRFLNAKATEFRPSIVRSSSASSLLRSQSPDLWAHNYQPSPTPSASLGRGSSNLAIAAPLIPMQSAPPGELDSEDGGRTPPIQIPQDSSRAAFDVLDDDDDPFSPFVVKPPPHNPHPLALSKSPSDTETQWSASSVSNSSASNSFGVPPNPDDYYGYNSHLQRYAQPGYFVYGDPNGSFGAAEGGYHGEYIAEGDLTPFEILSNIFGDSVPSSTLETALASSGYDFEGAMAWLVDQALPPPLPGTTPQGGQPTLRSIGGGVMLASREGPYGRSDTNGKNTTGRFAPPPKSSGASRVCRYFLAGDCRRSDCRFSHDLDRALCRFWLKGQCAKGEQCEFLHTLPQHIDVQGITNAMNRTGIVDDRDHEETRTEFPTLGEMHNRRAGPGFNRPFDSSRVRFAAAVKKPLPPRLPYNESETDSTLQGASGPVVPRASPRIRLRPPALVPTLPTGDILNKLYMAYRARAIELGAARNACLSRAAEAWRRGDGAGAKRHSREAQELNGKMGLEAGRAAARLVRERATMTVEAVRNRDVSWSDDPSDRTARGKMCGGGLGVCLGVASSNVVPDSRLTPEERTEAFLDLHGLHSNEAVEVIEDFLVALESEHFYGLAYLFVGEEKHTGTQDPSRGTSRARLAAGVRDWLFKWGYAWSERDGVICVDPLVHSQ